MLCYEYLSTISIHLVPNRGVAKGQVSVALRLCLPAVAVVAVAVDAVAVERLDARPAVGTVEDYTVVGILVRLGRIGFEAAAALVLVLAVDPEEGREYPSEVPGDSSQEDSFPVEGIAGPVVDLAAVEDSPVDLAEAGILALVAVDSQAGAAGADNFLVVLVHPASREHSCKFPTRCSLTPRLRPTRRCQAYSLLVPTNL